MRGRREREWRETFMGSVLMVLMSPYSPSPPPIELIAHHM
jgi:hypothetical protein